MCFGLDIFGTKKAAKINAKATMDSANMQAKSDREVARGNVLAQQTMIAQQKAAEKAAELLNDPQEAATVILSAEQDALPTDPITGHRKTRRSQFFSPATSGLNI